MTLPPIIEFQKIVAEGVRAFEGAADNPEGLALAIVEVLYGNGLEIVRTDADVSAGQLRQEETPAGSAATTAKGRAGKASGKAKADTEVDE